jgi:hypothetical protein
LVNAPPHFFDKFALVPHGAKDALQEAEFQNRSIVRQWVESCH